MSILWHGSAIFHTGPVAFFRLKFLKFLHNFFLPYRVQNHEITPAAGVYFPVMSFVYPVLYIYISFTISLSEIQTSYLNISPILVTGLRHQTHFIQCNVFGYFFHWNAEFLMVTAWFSLSLWETTVSLMTFSVFEFANWLIVFHKANGLFQIGCWYIIITFLPLRVVCCTVRSKFGACFYAIFQTRWYPLRDTTFGWRWHIS